MSSSLPRSAVRSLVSPRLRRGSALGLGLLAAMTTLAPAASADVTTPEPGPDTSDAPAGDSAVDPGTGTLDLDETGTPDPNSIESPTGPTGPTAEQIAAMMAGMFGDGKNPGPLVPETGPDTEDRGTDPTDEPTSEATAPTSDATAPTSEATAPTAAASELPAAATELAAAQPVLADAAQPTTEVAAASTAAASTSAPSASLAYTGANAGELTWAGLGLLAAGGAVTAGATRRRRVQRAS